MNEKEDFANALGQTLHFYGKTLDEEQLALWRYALRDHDIMRIKRALLAYIQHGKYAPKPADIIEQMHSDNRPEIKALPKSSGTCPDHISRAWLWLLGQTGEGLGFTQQEVTDAQRDEYIETVNREAHRAGEPGAIPAEYWLDNVWGRPHAA